MKNTVFPEAKILTVYTEISSSFCPIIMHYYYYTSIVFVSTVRAVLLHYMYNFGDLCGTKKKCIFPQKKTDENPFSPVCEIIG
jgi:hypothetical protein